MYFGSPHTHSEQLSSNPINTIASEPSDSEKEHWFKVDEGQGLHWTEKGLEHFSITV
jgi:hypothetical protein